MKGILKMLSVAVLLALALPASALTLITDDGVFKGTPEEIRALQGGDALGAITMLEGQKTASQNFEPDQNNTRNLGNYDRAFKDTYASGTSFVGGASGAVSSSFARGLTVTGQGNGSLTVNGVMVCLGNGVNCASFNSDAMWTYDNTIPGWYRASTTAEKYGIGDATPSALLELDGDANIVQLLLQGHSTQTEDIMQVMNNAGTVLFSITNAGNVSATGTVKIYGVTSSTDVRPTANNTSDLGNNAFAWRDAYVSGTAYIGTAVAPDVNDGADLGLVTRAWNDVFASGTIYAAVAVSPEANDGADLGAYTLAWNDVFSSGTVFAAALNANGNVTLGDATGDTITPNGRWAADLDPSADNARDFGAYGLAWNDLFASGTVYSAGLTAIGDVVLGDATGDTITPTGRFAADLDPSANNARDFGAFALSWRNLFASGTIYAGSAIAQNYYDVVSGTASTTIRAGAAATSTFSSSVTITEASATSTLFIGAGGSAGQGGCIVLASGDGTGNLYLFAGGGTLQLATSTGAKSCF